MQLSYFFKKKCLIRLSLLARTISLLRIIVFQSHLRAINDLVFFFNHEPISTQQFFKES